MYKGKTKKFRDAIHGYIDIPDVIVSNIIDTEQFQRLRYIEQTSMRSLYPAARHDRFIHSLGVYWLGTQAFKNFRNNAQNSLLPEEKNLLTDDWWNKQEILFSLACLLHDCAHAPFSHTLENMYTLRKIVPDDCSSCGLEIEGNIAELDFELLGKCQCDKMFAKDFLQKDKKNLNLCGVGAAHERMSSYCVIAEYEEAIKRVITEWLGESIDNVDIVFIVRMIIGCKYSESGIEKSIKNCIISMLNSSSIDVDGLDYIVRDAYMSGIDNFSIDYQRLLSSFIIIPVERFSYVKTKEVVLDGIWLKESQFQIDYFKSEMISGKLVIEKLDEIEHGNIKGLNCNVNWLTGELCSTNQEDDIQIDCIRSGDLQFRESCWVHKSIFTGVIKCGKRIISPLHPSCIKEGQREYILGYDKKSLSIIESAIEARNHEYLWVYTHPKVLYSSHYLQCELLRNSAKYLCCSINKKHFADEKLDLNCMKCDYCKTGDDESPDIDDYLLYILGYDSYFEDETGKGLSQEIIARLQEKGFVFYRTCNDDLNALFKRIYRDNVRRGELKSDKLEADFKEFFTRNHKKTLWKSFVEYDNFLKTCSENPETKDVIPRFCKRVVSKTNAKGIDYAYPDPEEQKVFEESGIADVVVIMSSVKTKELNPNETFIKFQNQTLRLFDIFSKENRKQMMNKDFYYIFGKMEKELSYKELVEMVKKLDG